MYHAKASFSSRHIKHGSGVLATLQESLKGLGVAPQSLQQLFVSIGGGDEGGWNHLRGIIQTLGRCDTREPDNEHKPLCVCVPPAP